MFLENDTDIIKEYRSGNENLAINSLIHKYRKLVFATALRYLQSEEDAEDVAQDVFIKAIKGLKKFEERSSLKTWLYKITVNLCKNILRKRKLTFWIRNSEENNIFENIRGSKNLEPEQELMTKDFNALFWKAISQLPDKQRETFSLRFFDNLKYEEISNMLGTSVSGLKANYFHAVQKISKYIKEHYN